MCVSLYPFSQIRSQVASNIRPQIQTSVVQIRPTQTITTPIRTQKAQSLPNSAQVTKSQASTGAQLKQIVTNNNVNINNNNNTKNNNNNNKNQVSIAVVSTVNSTFVANSKSSTTTTSPNSKSPTKSNALSNSHSSSITTPTTTPTKSPTFNNKTHHEKKSQGSAVKAKDKKTSLASVVAASAAASGSGTNSLSSSFYPSTFGDDDINDVAAMGGVNLAEESQRILGSTEYVGTQIRSCKDEVMLNLPILQQRIRQQMARHGLDEPSTDVAVLISHATQEHLKNIIEKLAVIAEHRIDILKVLKT